MIAQFLRGHPLFWLWTWQSTVWLGIGLLAAGGLFRGRPARAHFVLFLCVVLSLVTPLMTLGMKGLGWGFLSPGQTGRIPESGIPSAPVITHETKFSAPSIESRPDIAAADITQTSVQRPVQSIPSFPPATASTSPRDSAVPSSILPLTKTQPSFEINLKYPWLMVVFLLFLRLLKSFVQGHEIVRSSEEFYNPDLREALRVAVRRQGLMKFPYLRITGQLQSLVIWCWGRRPVLLIPRDMMSMLQEIEWESIFAHELAHWRRRDHWWKLFGQLAVCLVPWQPLLWIAIRQLDKLAELACDDWATDENATPEKYARTLLELAAMKEMPFAIPVASRGRMLARRVKRILGGQRSRPWCGTGWSLLVITAGMVMGCSMAMTQPRALAQKTQVEDSPQSDMGLTGNLYRDYRCDARYMLSGIPSWPDQKGAEGENADSPYGLGWKYFSSSQGENDDKQAAKWFGKAADQGDPRAQFVLGCMYKRGLGVAADFTQSVVWFRKAAEQGDPYAQLLMGIHYSEDSGVEQDANQAMAWYRRASEQAVKLNDTWILLNILANEYGTNPPEQDYQPAIEEGVKVPEEIRTIIEWVRRSADRGEVEAQYHLGYMYDKGLGVQADDTQAVTWYTKAAEQGHADAQSRLGDIYAGRRYIPEYKYIDIESAHQGVWIVSSRKDGNSYPPNPTYEFDDGLKTVKPVEKLYHNGHAYYERTEQDYKQAVAWYLRAAEQGHADAQSGLGVLYAMGRGVDQNDKQAAEWFRKAADQGHRYAQFSLGDQYYKGKGIEQDYRQAVTWYRKAAEQGHLYAQFVLGTMFLEGKGVEQDAKQAASWFQKAAESKHAELFYQIGKAYLEGKGSNQDYQQAASWFQKAAKQGNTSACYALGMLYIQGRGVPLDYVEGYKWILEYGERGPDNWILARIRPEVETTLQEIRDKMTDNQIAQAQAEHQAKMSNSYKDIWLQITYRIYHEGGQFVPGYDTEFEMGL
jgi:TPR repeat protein/beta-lactamase regulating signal transducer with metallopeptidase domain